MREEKREEEGERKRKRERERERDVDELWQYVNVGKKKLKKEGREQWNTRGEKIMWTLLRMKTCLHLFSKHYQNEFNKAGMLEILLLISHYHNNTATTCKQN